MKTIELCEICLTSTMATPERPHLVSLTDTHVLDFCLFSGFLGLKGLGGA